MIVSDRVTSRRPLAFRRKLLRAPNWYVAEVLADDPLAYWRFEEGREITDETGNGYDLDTEIGPVFGAASLLPYGGNGAVDFTGSGAQGLIPADNAALDVSSITVEAIIYATASATGVRSIVGRDDGSGNRSFQFRINSGKLNFIAFPSGGGAPTAASTANVNDSTIHHVVGVYNASTGDVLTYIDGSQDGSASGSGNLNAGLAPTIGVRVLSSDPFLGQVDEVAIYGSALSSTRIAAHAAAAGV